MTVSSNKRTIAVVGGGRWGRVVVSVLAQMELPFERVIAVSAVGGSALTKLMDEQFSSAHMRFSVVPSLIELLREQRIEAAIVVNSACLHYNTAISLLKYGVDVLVEKPVALSLAEVRTLVSCAEAAHAKLSPSLPYRFCTYLHRFADEMRKFGGTAVSFSLDWADCVDEERYGEKKSYDISLNIAQDVMPHIWAILMTTLQHEDFRPECCRIEHGGRLARFAVAKGELRGEVTLERDAEARRRFLLVHMSSGESFAIDFSAEPGTIIAGSASMPGDPLWSESPKPMARQLSYFFSSRPGSAEAVADKRACLASVAFSEQASALLKEQQRIILRAAFHLNRRLSSDQRCALRELFAKDLIERGLAVAGDNAGINYVATKIADAIEAEPHAKGSVFSDLLGDLKRAIGIPDGDY